MILRTLQLANRLGSAMLPLLAAQKSLSLVAIALLAVCGAGIVFFAERLRQEVDYLAIANSDSVQWSLTQFEVEFLGLEAAMLMAMTSEDADLMPIRTKFDIFYSRYETISTSSQYARLRVQPDVVERLTLIKRFLDSTVPIIDSQDAQLRESLPRLMNEVYQIERLVRDISLSGVEAFARAADERRQHVALTLAHTASLVIGLIVVLMILIMVLLLLVRLAWVTSRDHALVANRLTSIITTSLDAILVVDREGRILNFNGAAERIFGYSRAEAIGQKMAELIVPEHLRDRHHAGMTRYLDTGKKRLTDAGRVRLEAMRKGGGVFPVEVSISTAMSKQGEIFVSYISDVSEIVSAQAELVDARDKAIAGEKSKAEFIAVMSHEIRTPLNGLLGALDLLNDTAVSTGSERQLIDVMKKSGALLLNHVNDVLDISRLEASMVDITDRRFDANGLVRDVATGQMSLAEANGNELLIDVDDASLADVVGDPNQLSHLLVNLLGNAIKFTRNGRIKLHALRLPDGMVEFRVSDTGIGIPEKDIGHIFDDFVTLDASYSRTASGTGLGLGIARRLARAMGGTIGVESTEGTGSRFWVRIPLSPWPDNHEAAEERHHYAAATQPLEPEPTFERALEILLVEDNTINRLVVRSMLEKSGHRVSEAQDGREGVAMANEHPFDLILMDISMPVMDGVLATRAIRNGNGASRDVPIIAVTAHAMPADIARFRQAQMNEILIKPISRKALIRHIAAVACAAPNDAAGDEAALADANILVDIAALRGMGEDLGEEEGDRLMAQFLEDAECRLAALPAETLAAEDQADAIAQIHALAGSAALFGAHQLRARLSALESELKIGSDIEWSRLRSELMTTWRQTRDAFVQAQRLISEKRIKQRVPRRAQLH